MSMFFCVRVDYFAKMWYNIVGKGKTKYSDIYFFTI